MPEPVAELPDELCMHGMARLAWYVDGDRRLVFANGAARAVSARESDFVRRLCRQRASGQTTARPEGAESPGEDLLEWLRLEGIFDPGPAPE
jgi:hypothetical protein